MRTPVPKPNLAVKDQRRQKSVPTSALVGYRLSAALRSGHLMYCKVPTYLTSPYMYLKYFKAAKGGSANPSNGIVSF